MCVVCGCGATSRSDDGRTASPVVGGASDDVVPAVDPSSGDLHFGAGSAGVSVPGMSAARAIELETDVLGENARLAAVNRAHFRAHGVTAYDIVSSPGSGKTTLLCETIRRLAERRPSLPLAVIEGDQQTRLDADRIRETGAGAVQVNTGKGCHLDAAMVGAAFERLDLHASVHAGHRPRDRDCGHEHGHEGGGAPERRTTARDVEPRALLLIENVGNLVCPAMWDLGEAAKVVILSVTEGADKPLKYPDMFAAADLVVINKIDLLPYVDFDVDACIDAARRINPGIGTVSVSATTGEGIERWIDWLLRAAPADVAA